MISQAFQNESSDLLLTLIHGGWTSQVVCAAAELGLVEILSHRSQTLQQLAHSAQCDPQSLERLLRALISLGLISKTSDGKYAATALGNRLHPNAPDSLNAQAQWFGLHSWSLWGNLTESVRSGISARQQRGDHEHYADFADAPNNAQLFNRAMCELTHVVAHSLVNAYDFSGARKVVDVGGGHGELLIPILQGNPNAHGTVVDLKHALEGAHRHLAEAGFADRINVIEGDFFDKLPGDGDVYLLKAILHNWDDQKCAEILATLRRSMPIESRLLIVERVVPDEVDTGLKSQAVVRSDLNMLVGRGGRERSRAEFAALLAQAGFAEPRYLGLAEGFSAIETH